MLFNFAPTTAETLPPAKHASLQYILPRNLDIDIYNISTNFD